MCGPGPGMLRWCEASFFLLQDGLLNVGAFNSKRKRKVSSYVKNPNTIYIGMPTIFVTVPIDIGV